MHTHTSTTATTTNTPLPALLSRSATLASELLNDAELLRRHNALIHNLKSIYEITQCDDMTEQQANEIFKTIKNQQTEYESMATTLQSTLQTNQSSHSDLSTAINNETVERQLKQHQSIQVKQEQTQQQHPDAKSNMTRKHSSHSTPLASKLTSSTFTALSSLQTSLPSADLKNWTDLLKELHNSLLKQQQTLSIHVQTLVNDYNTQTAQLKRIQQVYTESLHQREAWFKLELQRRLNQQNADATQVKTLQRRVGELTLQLKQQSAELHSLQQIHVSEKNEWQFTVRQQAALIEKTHYETLSLYKQLEQFEQQHQQTIQEWKHIVKQQSQRLKDSDGMDEQRATCSRCWELTWKFIVAFMLTVVVVFYVAIGYRLRRYEIHHFIEHATQAQTQQQQYLFTLLYTDYRQLFLTAAQSIKHALMQLEFAQTLRQ